MFQIPADSSRRKLWCNLIKRHDGKDGFKITDSTRVCEKHFEPSLIYRAPGGTRKRLCDGAKPLLHTWNDFSMEKNKRSLPKQRPSPQKKMRCQSPEPAPAVELEVPVEPEPLSEIELLRQEVRRLRNENSKLTKENQEYQKLVTEHDSIIQSLHEELANVPTRKQHFTNFVTKSNETCKFYTGFPTVDTMHNIFQFLDAGPDGENVILHNNKEFKGVSSGRKRTFTPYESYLVTLVKLRRGFSVKHLSYLFETSEATISNTFNTWINFMYLRLGSVCIWPSREQIQKSMPQSMKELFPTTRCIIDCAEFKVEVPTSLFTHKMLYSDYKSHTTVKVLVGIAPGGGFTFISSAYAGSISDKNIVVKSGFLNPLLWEPGDSVMADRGFNIREYLQPLKVNLIIPAFLEGREQFTNEELVLSQQIAHERIHVERMIQRLKSYHVFDRVIPLTMIGTLNQIITVCALLSNFQNPIIKEQS